MWRVTTAREIASISTERGSMIDWSRRTRCVVSCFCSVIPVTCSAAPAGRGSCWIARRSSTRRAREVSSPSRSSSSTTIAAVRRSPEISRPVRCGLASSARRTDAAPSSPGGSGSGSSGAGSAPSGPLTIWRTLARLVARRTPSSAAIRSVIARTIARPSGPRRSGWVRATRMTSSLPKSARKRSSAALSAAPAEFIEALLCSWRAPRAYRPQTIVSTSIATRKAGRPRPRTRRPSPGTRGEGRVLTRALQILPRQPGRPLANRPAFGPISSRGTSIIGERTGEGYDGPRLRAFARRRARQLSREGMRSIVEKMPATHAHALETFHASVLRAAGTH